LRAGAELTSQSLNYNLTNTELNQSIASWDRQSKNPFININVRRSTFIAFAISLAIHGAVLFATRNHVIATASAPKTLNIRLVEMPANPPKHIISHKTIMTKKQMVKTKRPIQPVTVVKAAPPLPAPLPAEKNAPTDLMSYINEKRRIAQALEDSAAFDNASAYAHEPTAEEQRDANIKRNLQQTGTNGIFEIRHKSFSTGQFSFRGWKQNYSNSRLELIDVEAGPDNNIDLAIVRKMIEIIRREYQGNFRWESERLGRVVVLSARMEDNSGLEDFLMQEFFSAEGHYR
jgi:hypothetical protein